MIRLVWYLFSILLICSCNPIPGLIIKEIEIPIKGTVTTTPNLYVSPEGSLFLSWTEQSKDSSTLFYSKLKENAWSTPIRAAGGMNWMVNWADFPSLATFAGTERNVIAQYLQIKDTADRYHYDVKLALSRDEGEHFKIMNNLHDTIPAEHGFVSLLPYSFDQVLAVWLDGSAQAKSEMHDSQHDHDHTMGGAMQLWSAKIDFDGNVIERLMIDDRVCDCCQTDLAMTAQGPIAVYRNRDESEIRDIYYTRYHEGQWSTPKPIHDDHWKINGCPVNGPSIATSINQVAIVWYTESNNSPHIQLIYSNDAGNTFSDPVEIKSQFTLGRLDIVWIDDDHIAITHLDKPTKESDVAMIKLEVYSLKNKSFKSYDIDQISSKRKSGFPILEKYKASDGKVDLYLAYTLLSSENITSIKTARVTLGQ